MRRIEPITGIEGVATGATANVPLPVDERLHGLIGYVTNNGAAASPVDVIESITIKVDGKIVRDIQVPYLVARSKVFPNALFGLVAGQFAIDFSEPERASVMGEEALAWNLNGWAKSATLSIRFKTGLTNPTLALRRVYDRGSTVIQDGDKVREVQNIVHFREMTFNVPAGAYDITTLVPRGSLQRVWLFGTQNVTAVRVKADGVVVHDMTNAENADLLLRYGLKGLYADTGIRYPVVFDYTNQVTDGLTAKALELRVTSAAAQTLTAVIEERLPGFNS